MTCARASRVFLSGEDSPCGVTAVTPSRYNDCRLARILFGAAPSELAEPHLMSIDTDSVVTIHYTLKDDAGAVLDRSEPGTPLAYLHGHGNIISGLEKQLTGKNAGDALCVTVPPAEGYGEYDEQLVQSVPRRALRGIKDVRTGMRLHEQTAEGTRAVTVTRVIGDMVTLDGNHPLAGKTLYFDVSIEDVRPASEEELAHGHVHGAHGHAHH